jgi:pimeloyl-ACP methyl ester carboxylesterase
MPCDTSFGLSDLPTRRALIAGGAALAVAAAIPAARAEPSPVGRLITLPARSSAHVAPRRVTIWLPPEYDRVSWGFPVVYLHDGQLMADPAGSSFHARIGTILADMVGRGQAIPAIIVGIWSGPERLREFSPAAFLPGLPASTRVRVESACGGPSLSDAYLRYLVEELKPSIDRLFRTRPGCPDTSIMGWGMGGMAALYAVARRPGAFGNAAWISGPKPLVPYSQVSLSCDEASGVERAFASAFDRAIPRAGSHRFYLDYGDVGSDLFAPAFQGAAEPVLYDRGYRRGRDLLCEGAPHPDFRAVSEEEKVRAALSLMLRPCGCTPRPGDD